MEIKTFIIIIKDLLKSFKILYKNLIKNNLLW